MKTSRNWTLAVAAILPWLAAGCGNDTTGPGPNSGTSVSLSMATAPGTPTAAIVGAPAFDLVLADGATTITITSVEVVVRDIELERMSDDDCDSIPNSGDLCEKFETGPAIFDVPMDGSVVTTRTISDVPFDTYDELEFDVHKPSLPEDAAFVTANPTFADISIRVRGLKSDGVTPFLYETDLNETQEIVFPEPLVVNADSGPVNVTLTLDVDGWFRDLAGALLPDPESANKGGADENLVKDNIRASIDVFEDNNHDGLADS